MKRKGKKGFTLVEIMLVISILGLLAALCIPSILGAYSSAQQKAMARNITDVEKAKGILSLPRGIMVGAMGLDENDAKSFDCPEVNGNLCAILRITDISQLNLGDRTFNPGNMVVKACYE
jgi:prepilin-type N-terminal cleavage/methylation domain-containing protein